MSMRDNNRYSTYKTIFILCKIKTVYEYYNGLNNCLFCSHSVIEYG